MYETVQVELPDAIQKRLEEVTTVLGRQRHRIEFLMHDNRLYQGIDPRQCAEVFELANELCHKQSCQYIASLNEDKLVAIRSNMEDPSRFDELFTKNTVLELTDDSAEGKLLGISVDLHYDKASNQED